MTPHIRDFGALDVIPPLMIAAVFITAVSMMREPERRRFNAVLLSGAGAAYLSGGLGGWEFAFTTLLTWVAYRGLDSYAYIGAGWLLHTWWDALHHFYGDPIVPFAPLSSAGCAITDAVLAVWFFAGAPSASLRLRRTKPAV